jgi:cyanate lyase
MSTPTAPLDKAEAGQIIDRARIRHGLTWAQLADAIDRPPVWTVAALLGRHPVPAAEAATVAKLLDLGDDVVEALQLQPTRVADRAATSDPTIYRFYEALNVYGPALKALISRGVRRRDHERDQLQALRHAPTRSGGRPRRRHVRRQVPALPVVSRGPAGSAGPMRSLSWSTYATDHHTRDKADLPI